MRKLWIKTIAGVIPVTVPPLLTVKLVVVKVPPVFTVMVGALRVPANVAVKPLTLNASTVPQKNL